MKPRIPLDDSLSQTYRIFWILLSSLILLLPVSVSAGSCRNLFGREYDTVEGFTDRMCLYCVDRYITNGTVNLWHNSSRMDSWYIDVNRFGNQFQDHEDVVHLLNYTLLKSAYDSADYQSHPILRELKDSFARDALMRCCAGAEECCHKMMAETEDANYLKYREDYCPMEWDGDQCWPSVPVGSKFYQTCPDNYFLGSHFRPLECIRDRATRKCNREGFWDGRFHTYYKTNISVTDQRSCWKLNFPVRKVSSQMIIVLQLHSICFVISSIVLLYVFRLKNGLSATIHLNFYASIILSSILAIFYEFLIVRPSFRSPETEVSPFVCKAVNILEKLFRLINFNWMLIEGFNFYQMVVRAQKYHLLKNYKNWIYAFGWAFPVPVMIGYTFVRASMDDSTCWTDSIGKWEIILLALPYTACLLNFLFLANIIYVIIQRFCLNSNSSTMIAYGVRTSLILLPIFGVQYILHFVPADTNWHCEASFRNLHYSHIVFDAGQGIIVSVALSLFNRELIVGIGRMFTRTFRKQSKEFSGLSTHTNVTTYSNRTMH